MSKAKKTKKAGKTTKRSRKPVVQAKGKRGVLRLKLAGASHRVNTHGRRGSTSREVAPAEDLPIQPREGRKPIILPTPEDSVKVLRGLAELNDLASDAHERYLDLKEKAKDAKEKWEGLAEEVQRKLRLATHGSDLPLFDAQEREDDLKALETAKTAGEVAPGSTIGEGAAPTAPPDPETPSVGDEAPF